MLKGEQEKENYEIVSSVSVILQTNMDVLVNSVSIIPAHFNTGWQTNVYWRLMGEYLCLAPVSREKRSV